MLIAATARSIGHAVITHNVHHSNRIDGLEVEDWFAE